MCDVGAATLAAVVQCPTEPLYALVCEHGDSCGYSFCGLPGCLLARTPIACAPQAYFGGGGGQRYCSAVVTVECTCSLDVCTDCKEQPWHATPPHWAQRCKPAYLCPQHCPRSLACHLCFIHHTRYPAHCKLPFKSISAQCFLPVWLVSSQLHATHTRDTLLKHF